MCVCVHMHNAHMLEVFRCGLTKIKCLLDVMLSTWVNKYICFGELANIVFRTETDGSYPKTWHLPTKHSNTHNTNVHIQCKANLKSCRLSNGL